jgi:hypothetical protein
MVDVSRRTSAMKPLAHSVVALILVCACSKTDDQTFRRVYFHCHDLTHAVNEMATSYQARLALSQTTTLSEEQQVAADMKYRIVGREGRGERALAMSNDFLFCAGVRYDDPLHIDPLRDKFGVAGQTYREADDLATAAKAAGEMAAITNELEKFEIRP